MKVRFGSAEESVDEEKELQEVNLRFSESGGSLAGLYNQPPLAPHPHKNRLPFFNVFIVIFTALNIFVPSFCGEIELLSL